MTRRRYHRSQYEKYTGSEAEYDAIQEVKPAARHKDYLEYHEAFQLAYSNQPENWDPLDPPVEPSPFPNEMHFAVQEELEQELGETDFHLGLFTTAGSTLDKMHGTDCLFVLKVGEYPSVYVPADLTINPEKAEREHKPNVVVYLLPENFFDKEETSPAERQKIEQQIAKQVVPLLISEYEAVKRGNMRAQTVSRLLKKRAA